MVAKTRLYVSAKAIKPPNALLINIEYAAGGRNDLYPPFPLLNDFFNI